MKNRNVYLIIGLLLGICFLMYFDDINAFIKKGNNYSMPMQAGRDYPTYGGNNAGNRYSPLNQINSENVKDLQPAWIYDVKEEIDTKGVRPMEIQCQPIVVNGILYATTAKLKLFALNAGTGEQIWKFDPFTEGQARYRPNRGVNYWEEGNDKRILYSAGSSLFAIDAITGEPIKSFGVNGKVDLHTGLENDRYDIKDLAITSTTPGVIYKNIFVTGSTVSESGDALPGHIRGFDVITGNLLWTFHTIPQPGDLGYDTWSKDAYKKIGGANNWAGMVLDEKRGVVYLGTGSPSVDFYGAERTGKNLFANCILALDAETGILKWYYQTIHHDLWDYDLPNPPNLVTVKHEGKMIDAVVQTTKDGLIYVLNRDNGESLFPVEEITVPSSQIPGEQSWPTQKFPVLPLPFSRQVYTEADIPNKTDFPEAHTFAKQVFEQSHRGKYMPPSIEGTLGFGISGGAEWGGSAVDPDGILYQNSSEMPYVVKLINVSSNIKKSNSKGNTLYLTNCASCHGIDRKGGSDESQIPSLLNITNKLSTLQIDDVLKSGRGRMPSFQHISKSERSMIIDFLKKPESKQVRNSDIEEKSEDFPYFPPFIRTGGGKFVDKEGYPAIKPPWGTLNAINLNTGEYLWRVPLGEYSELTKKGIPITGTENAGGPVVTAGGLIFIAGTRDEKIRAFDNKTGNVVWEYQLPAGAFATPITYEVDGKQFVVIAVGGTRWGHKQGGWYMAFALK